MEKVWFKFKYAFNEMWKDKTKKNIFIITSSFVLILFVIVVNSSFAFYKSENSFSLISAVVGDKYLKDNDYTLLVYIEDPSKTNNNNNKTYKLTNEIPSIGYTYNNYNCKNSSILTYDETNRKASTVITGKEKCSIYFDLINSDITINLYIENGYESNTYLKEKKIPSNINYELNTTKSECFNKNNIKKDNTISYRDNRINVTSDEIVTCNIYLDQLNV